MAVTLSDATGKRLQGLSSDDKPLDVDDGTIMHVVDTGEEYIFYDGAWEIDKRRIYALRNA